MFDAYLTTRQAADVLGLHLGTLAHQRAAGRSPMEYIHVGRTVLYPSAEVQRYALQLGRGE